VKNWILRGWAKTDQFLVTNVSNLTTFGLWAGFLLFGLKNGILAGGAKLNIFSYKTIDFEQFSAPG
jgi:hypothetical protein